MLQQIVSPFLAQTFNPISLYPQDEHYYYPTYFDETLTGSQANGFDADSEGSDYEIMPNVNANRMSETLINMNQHVSSSADANGNPPTDALQAATPTAVQATTTTANTNEMKTASLPASPVKPSATLKRPHKSADTSKFNRSTRESDHLATYYFRHPDTEPESGTNNGTGGDCSSQDATSDVYSEDDQWFYTNGNDGNENADGNPAFARNNDQHEIDEINGNGSQSFDLTCLPMRVNYSGRITVPDEVDSPAVNGMVCVSQCGLFCFFPILYSHFITSPLLCRMARPHTFHMRQRRKNRTHW